MIINVLTTYLSGFQYAFYDVNIITLIIFPLNRLTYFRNLVMKEENQFKLQESRRTHKAQSQRTVRESKSLNKFV
jgi:hypothetical protein